VLVLVKPKEVARPDERTLKRLEPTSKSVETDAPAEKIIKPVAVSPVFKR